MGIGRFLFSVSLVSGRNSSFPANPTQPLSRRQNYCDTQVKHFFSGVFYLTFAIFPIFQHHPNLIACRLIFY